MRYTCISISAVIATLMCYPIARADDLDIYFARGGTNPADSSNVFFMLDISRSMLFYPPGGGYANKLTMMKDAMVDLISIKDADDTLTNINIGYGTFHSPGGRIDYPILPIDGAGLNGGTVRNEIISAIQSIQYRSGTPLVSAYYESMAYMMGKSVLFGKSGSAQSHQATFTGSIQPVYNFGNLTANECSSNAIVLLSDGEASIEAYGTMVTDDPVTMNALPIDQFDNQPCLQTPLNSTERCGRELANYAFKRDDSSDPNAPPLHTHTIGFGISADSTAEKYLEDTANAGGGQYQRASNKDELVEAFLNVSSSLIETTGAFSPPTVPVSTGNRLYSEPEIYLSLFETSSKPIWHGNVKKFHICSADDDSCEPGQYLGSDGQVAVDTDGNLLDSGVGDVFDETSPASASNVLSGGLGSKVGDWQSRNIYTWTKPDYPSTVDSSANTSSRGWELYKVDAATEVISSSSQEPNLSDTTDIAGSGGRLRKRLFQSHGQCDVGGIINTDCMSTLIKFLLGGKTRDTQADGLSSSNRWPIADVLHSEILTIPYGQTATGEIINKVLFATNDGGLHLHDAYTGDEDFVIYPQEVLDQLDDLEAAENGSNHIYGLDGTPTLRIRDVDQDYKIEPADGDFVHLFIGMRRGGYYYYAFNLTPDSELTETGTSIGTPELLWTISGTNNSADPLYRVGQTWSRPQPTRILYLDNGNIVSRSVLIFGGGYDPDVEDQSGNFGPGSTGSNLGNAIYIVDADNGEVLWWTSSDYTATAGVPGVEASDMLTSIPSDIKLVDSNNDRRTDRLYATDLMGQVWRVDLHPALANNTVGRLVSLSESGDPDDVTDNSNERKFFYQPDFVRIRDERTANSQAGSDSYDAIALVSGNRANPTDSTVDDRFYLIRDYLDGEPMLPLGSGSPTNYPACNPDNTAGCSISTGIVESGLMDLTNTIIPTSSEIGNLNSDEQTLATKNGYFFDLLSDSEIGFSNTQTLDGKLYFTTYDPEVSLSEALEGSGCGIGLGSAKLYIVDVKVGAPAIGLTGSQTSSSRAFVIGSHPVTRATPVIREGADGQSLLEAVHQAGTRLPPDPAVSELTFYPSYWFQK